jgi:hypothetical protein
LKFLDRAEAKVEDAAAADQFLLTLGHMLENVFAYVRQTMFAVA